MLAATNTNPTNALRVLIPLDGSPLAERAFLLLPCLRKLGALSLRLLSVVNSPEGPDPLASDDQLVCDPLVAEIYLKAIAKRLTEDNRSAPLIAVRNGPPAEIIMEEALLWGADFVLLSTHGRSGLQRWRLGSIADAIIRGSPVKSLVVGPAAQPADSIATIIVGLDGSSLAEQAKPVAATLASASHAAILLARVVPIPAAGTELAGGLTLDSEKTAAREYLEASAATLQSDLPIRCEVTAGSPAEELLALVRQTKRSLLVLASHHRSGLPRAVLGSVTDWLIREGPAPVLVLPASD